MVFVTVAIHDINAPITRVRVYRKGALHKVQALVSFVDTTVVAPARQSGTC